MISTAVALAERAPLPDALLRAAVALLVGRTDRGLRDQAGAAVKFAHDMPAFAIAEHTAAANAQHYEVPAAFFQHVLGPHLKYSSCFYERADASLGDAEAAALQLTAEHADLRDGQHILELGCGWGSLSLWMAQHY
ncbi:MAG: class I SAM-dependent methyltransferase, partial [Tardiphaga sp.]